jgi:hypothetical protein
VDISVRHVVPEILDSTDPSDPQAMRSRRDLRRVHRAMRTVSILGRAVDRLQLAKTPRNILELGGGDGTLLLRFARTQSHWSQVSLTLLDNQNLVSAETHAAFLSLGWNLRVIQKDVLQWASEPGAGHHDLCLTSLFLHHFGGADLSNLMRAIANRCDALVACEPRRNAISLLGSRAIGLLGTNHITRQDAVTSVVAGFGGSELSALWPADLYGWFVEEYPAFPFIHCFAAMMSSVRKPAGSP